MSATILDGREYATAIRQELTDLAIQRNAEVGYTITLAIVVVREPNAATVNASDIYTRQLQRTAQSIGIDCRIVDLPLTITLEEFRVALHDLNEDKQIHGIIVQLPLPPHIDREVLLDTIKPERDVDGVGSFNAGSLFLNLPARVSATCAAVMEVLDRAAIPLDGKRVIIVGASTIVGKPLMLMLLQRHATVSVCHIYTQDLSLFTQQADILIVAVGKPGLITSTMVRPGAVVIDVGINVLPDGTVVGDVDFTAVREIAGAITPVPGGVGPLTNLMVIRQTLTTLDNVVFL
jgi:methylenetetrahydrofolate dehydrogenase (NADP+)/methenyltetrahydrofolate cyclohydrolase